MPAEHPANAPQITIESIATWSYTRREIVANVESKDPGVVGRPVVFAILAAIHTTAALAQGPAEDTLRQIIEEGNPAYLDWSTAVADRELIGRLYAANGYRLLWSDGEKPSTAALVLLQELRHAADRGLDPEDYPGNRLAVPLDRLDRFWGIRAWSSGRSSMRVCRWPAYDSSRTCTTAVSIPRPWGTI